MNQFTLDLPLRTIKPRKTGLTILIDNGYPLRFLKIQSKERPIILILSNSAGGHR